jgi:glycosyltransferase involved in cell wall biosynthesis
MNKMSSTTSSNEYRILFCATYPNQPTGYSRIASVISNVLANEENVKVYYFGFSNFPATSVQRYAHPKIEFIDVYATEGVEKENFGCSVIAQKMLEIQPHMLFIYNDVIVTCRLFNALQPYKQQFPERKYKVVVYLDLVYKFEKSLYVDYVKREADYVFVMSDCWKQHLVDDFHFSQKKIKVFPHGFSSEVFQQIPKDHARHTLNFDQDDFIILNTNRNTYRKMWDVTIESFLRFLKQNDCNERIKMLVNCTLNSESGYNILELIRVYCKQLQLDFDTVVNLHIKILPNSSSLTDQQVNLMYCAADVGLNTCCGEGFGLCNLEGACLGLPQIVSQVGGLKDIFEEFPSMTVEPMVKIQCPELLDGHLGQLEIISASQVVEKLQKMYDHPDQVKKLGGLARNKLRVKYNWDRLIEEFLHDFESIQKN